MPYFAKFKEDRGWNVTDNTNLNYKIVEEIDPALHVDATDVMSWHWCVGTSIDDYIKMRDFAKQVFVPKWNTLTDHEKTHLFLHFVYPTSASKEELDALIPPQDQVPEWIVSATRAKACRERRWEATRRKVSFYLTPQQSMDLYVSVKDYSLDYKDANIPSLIHWIGNTADPSLGIDFTTSGFAQKSYFSSQLRDLMLDVLVNGNY